VIRVDHVKDRSAIADPYAVDVLSMWLRVWFSRRRLAQLRPLSDPERQRWERFYRQYRRTWHWQRLRRKIGRRAGGVCERCGVPRNLQVHHRTCARLGRQRLDDTELLSGGCHLREHRR
jgi:hypothetical protein